MIKALLYAGVKKSEYDAIRSRIASADRTMVQVISGLATVLIAGMFVSALFVGGVSMNRTVYGVGAVVSLVLFVSSLVFKQSDRLVTPMVYMSYSIFYLYGIMIGAITDPHQKTVTFMVMLVFLPVLFIGRPIYSIAVSAVFIYIFIGLCFRNKTGEVLSNDIIDTVDFGLLGMVSGVIISCGKVRGFLLEKELKVANDRLKETNIRLRDATRTDLLTDMQNRNAYEKDLYVISRECRESIGCVYIDVNGLKYLNDNFGHDQGDRMLKAVADEIKRYFGSEHSYRIGGDEFVIFVPDPGFFEIKTKVDGFTAEIETMDYHTAIGWKIHNLESLSMKDLIEDAEKFMVEKKAEFYKQADFDRRKN